MKTTLQHDARGSLEMIAAMAISGTIGWFVVRADLPVAVVIFWRCAFGAVVLGLAVWRRGLFRVRISRCTLLLSVAGGLTFTLNWALLFLAFPRASIAVATVVYNTQPFMLIALSAALLGGRPSAQAFVWLLVAFGGLVLVALHGHEASGGGAAYLSGVLLALGAALCYALTALAAKLQADTPAPLIMLIQLVVGGLLAAPFAAITAPSIDAARWAVLITMGVVHTGLAGVLLFSAIQKLPAHQVGMLSFIYPAVAVVVDALAFDNWLSPVQIAGVALILIAAAASALDWPPPARRRTST